MTNLAATRKRRRMTTAELSQRLSELGRPILANGITKIEKGARRVDTDDLVALAVALDVTPNLLLLPERADGTTVALTPATEVTAEDAWRWATGDSPLPGPNVPRMPAGPLSLEEWYAKYREVRATRDRFRTENRPYEPARETDIAALYVRHDREFLAFDRARQALLEAGAPASAVEIYFEQTMTEYRMRSAAEDAAADSDEA